MYKKLEQACVANWSSFLSLQIRASVVTNWGSYYKLAQPLLQNTTAITNWGKICYKSRHVLQILQVFLRFGACRFACIT